MTQGYKPVSHVDVLFAKQIAKGGIDGFRGEGKTVKLARMMALTIVEQLEDGLTGIGRLLMGNGLALIAETDIALAAVVGVFFAKVFQQQA